MKKIIVLLSLALSVSSYALEVPSSAFRIDKLDEARALAAKEEKPLCFVYTMESLKPT